VRIHSYITYAISFMVFLADGKAKYAGFRLERKVVEVYL